MPKAILELPEMPESCKQCKLGHYDELYDITHCDILRVGLFVRSVFDALETKLGGDSG